MNRNALRMLAIICLGNLLYASTTLADLGNCFIYRDGNPHLDGKDYDALAKKIYDAYMRSLDSAEHLVFLLDFSPAVRPKGSYTMTHISLNFGGSWPMQGYRITASDMTGLENGAAEIIKTFQDGRIYDLKQGDRNGPVDKPVYKQQPK